MNKIYNSWYIKVSNTDELYFEVKWNKNSFPILFFHGWPWWNFKEKDEIYFDLAKNQKVILLLRHRTVITWL